MDLALIDLTPRLQTAMALVLLCALFVIVRSLLHRTKDDGSPIDLDMLILEWNPKTSRYEMSIIRVLALGSFAVTGWIMVYLTMAGKMTEGYMGLFNIMWVAPLLVALGVKPFMPAAPKE